METTDIWFAAFLKFNGYSLSDYTVISRGKGRYKFDISKEDYKKAKLEFLSSESSKIKQIMEELKDLLY